MPFSGPSSYLSTTDEFIGHWTDVNAALTPDLVLAGGYDLADLIADRATLAADITALEAALNIVEGFRTTRDNQKEPLRERMRQLKATVQGVLAGSSYVGQVRDLPSMNASPGVWIIAMDDYSHLWTTINAAPPAGFTPPLLLTGAYTLANFNTDIAALKATLTSWVQAEQDMEREIDERDATYQKIRDQLVRYRLGVEGSFPEDHPLILSIPRLSPLPGHTPEPSTLEGSWNGDTEEADFTWSPSDDPDLKDYQLRRSGPPYNTNIEVVVATFPPGTLSASTNAGLTVPGASMAFKLYVRLNTGNEKGSNAVTITRIEG